MADTQAVRRPRITGAQVPQGRSGRWDRTQTGMTVEQLLAASILDLKKVCPLFFAALCVVPRIESEEVASIAVSPDKLYYNSAFVATLTREQLSFYLIHGLYHILMQHHLRGRGRDPERWNMACDLYINRCISHELGVMPGEPPVQLVSESGQSAAIQMPEGELYDGRVDIEHDTPEHIYKHLEEDDKQDQKTNSDGYGTNGEKGRDGKDESRGEEGTGDGGQQGSGAAEDGSGSEESNQQPEEEQQPEPGDRDDVPDEDAGGPGDSGQQQTSGGAESPQDAGTDAQPEQSDAEHSQSQPEQDAFSPQPQDAAQLDGKPRPDLVDDQDSVNDSETSQSQKNRRLLSKIAVTYQQLQQGKQGRGTTYDAVAQALVEQAPRVDWRVLLQNRLIALQTEEKSLSYPDRRFVHRGLYLEGPVEEEELLADIKICVDTSASMSDRDVAVALHQIGQLLRQYRVKAELVFWDEEVEAVAPFETNRELEIGRKQAMGRGGTNPNCLFERFSRTSALGYVQKQAQLLLIFTDGYFDPLDRRYRRAFDRDTIWILCAQESKPLEEFRPGFGHVARLRSEGWN